MKKGIHFLQKALALTLTTLLWWTAGTCQATENQAVIDVLMVFDTTSRQNIQQTMTTEGVTLHPMSVEQTAELAINQLNRILVNSKIGNKVKFRNAGILLSSYETTKILNGENTKNKPDDLTAMRTGLVEGLEKAREESKADLVIMFTYYPVNGPHIAGSARPIELKCLYMPTNVYEPLYQEFGQKEGFATTFNVRSIRLADTTFSHEICHLLGAGHSDTQFMQCGPQAEMDAAGCYPDNEQLCTLMSYNGRQDPTTDNLQVKFSTPLLVLSHPGTVVHQGKEVTVGDENYHNNAAVVVRHASAVAAFRVSGREKAINDSPDEAIAMPTLVPFSEKFQHIMTGKINALMENGTVTEYYANLIARENNIDPRTIDRKALFQELWKNRRKVYKELTEDASIYSQLIDNEFMRHNPEENFISCTLGTTVGGTKESGEQGPDGGMGNIVWYKVTLPCDGDLEIAVRRAITTRDFQPVMGVYYGSQKSKFKQIEHRETQNTADGSFIKSISVNVPGNTPLYIAVDSAQGSQPGNFCLMVRHVKGTYNGKPLTEGDSDEDKGKDEDEDKGKDGDKEKGKDKGKGIEKARTEPEWDSLDITLLALCIIMFLSCTVMGYLLWLQSLKTRQLAPKSVFDEVDKPASTAGRESAQEYKTDVIQINAYPPNEPGFVLNLRGTLSDGTAVDYNINLKDVKNTHNYYIGRDKKMSHFVINDSTISGCHAVLKVRADEKGEMLLLGDAGSTNGTWVNGRRLYKDECAKVKLGQTLQLGRCTFTISTK